MSYVLFSAVGDSDPVRDCYDGPFLHIVRHYAPVKVCLFLTAEMSRRDEAHNIYERAIHHVSPGCEVIKTRTQITDANNFDAFHSRFGALIQQIHEESPDAEILLNVSSGTPQIKTTMCLEVVSNYLPLRPIQVSTPVRGSGRATGHFNEENDNLDLLLLECFDNEPDAENRCSEPNLLSFRKSILKEQIKAMTEKYDYLGAHELFSRNSAMFGERAGVLIDHAYYRSLPDPKKAKDIVKALPDGDADALYPIKEAAPQEACEYFLLTQIKSRRSEIADFVVRIKNLAEYLAEEYLDRKGVLIERFAQRGHNGEYKMDAESAGQYYPGLLEYMKAQYARFATDPINLGAWIAILEFFKLTADGVLVALRAVYDVRIVRNQAAHGLTPITEDKLPEKSSAICDKLKDALRQMYKNSVPGTAFGVYERINREINIALEATREDGA
jgi:CRISPR type III-A/MTUBE-associated protein Csm6